MIGATIGGWIGSLDAVTQPLADTFQAIFNTFGTTFDLIVQVGKDLLGVINGLVRMIPGVSKGFNLLRFALFALLSPFKLLEIGINGIYDLYLSIKKNTVGLNKEEEARLNERRTQRATDEFTIQGREAAGFTLAQQKAAEYAKFKEAQLKGDKEAMNRTAEYMKSIDRLMKFRGEEPAKPPKPAKNITTPPVQTTPAGLSAFSGMFNKPAEGTPTSLSGLLASAPKPAKPAPAPPTSLSQLLASAPKPLPTAKPTAPVPISPVSPKATPPAVVGAVAAAPKEIAQTAANTLELNQKAATQITQAESIRTATQQTQKNTTVSTTTLGNIRSGIMAVSNRIGMLQAAMLRDLNNIEAGVASISSLLSSGQLRVQGAGPGGGPMGTATGNLGRAQNLASQYGLSLTSYFRAGDKGYHGLGRAMDFSNGVSTPQQMEFAQAMVAQYGTSLKELIYTPLGFGIKDGVRVPLSYWGPGTNLGHYDHVHVAFANGPQDGRMFTQMGGPYGAQSWERSMVPGSVKVASITGNSGEGFGGETSVVNNFTITQRDGEDGEALANRVATLFYDAMNNAQSASVFG
jgi:hypothetical protein